MDLKKIFAGDVVLIDQKIQGFVLFSSISDSYGNGYSKHDWPEDQYRGIMIIQDNGALVFHEESHFEQPHSSIEILEKGGSNNEC